MIAVFKSPLGGVKSHPERDDKVFTHKKVPLTGHDSSYGATAASGGRDWVPFFVDLDAAFAAAPQRGLLSTI